MCVGYRATVHSFQSNLLSRGAGAGQLSTFSFVTTPAPTTHLLGMSGACVGSVLTSYTLRLLPQPIINRMRLHLK